MRVYARTVGWFHSGSLRQLGAERYTVPSFWNRSWVQVALGLLVVVLLVLQLRD